MTVAGTRSTSRSSAQLRDHPVGELPGTGAAEQPGAGLGGQAQRVLADQAPGVGVVGRDRRLAGQHRRAPRARGVEVVEQPGPGEAAQPGAHPDPELLGGLAGERQPEDLLGQHLPRGDQPDHARGHRLGLARAGPGDDERRAGRRGDHRGLLVRGPRQAERGGEGLRGQHATVLPQGSDSSADSALHQGWTRGGA